MPSSDWKKKEWLIIVTSDKKKEEKKNNVLSKKVLTKPSEKPKKVQKPLKRTPLKRPTKPITQIGKRTKERIKENGTESAFFIKVALERTDANGYLWCEVCGVEVKWAVIDWKLIRPECFSHNLSKGRYPAFRYKSKNIRVVCGCGCHELNDKNNAGNDIALIQEITS